MENLYTAALIASCMLYQSGWSDSRVRECMWEWMAERDDSGEFVYWLYFSFDVGGMSDDLDLRRFCRQQARMYWWPVHTVNGVVHMPWVDGMYRMGLVDEETRKYLMSCITDGTCDLDWAGYREATYYAVPYLVRRYGIKQTRYLLWRAYEAELDWKAGRGRAAGEPYYCPDQ